MLTQCTQNIIIIHSACIQFTHNVIPWPNRRVTSCKLNLCRDLHWVAKWTCKFPCKSQKKATISMSPYWKPCIHCYNNEWMSLNLLWLGLGGQTVKNLCQLVCKVIASQCKCMPGLAKWGPKWTQVSTCESVPWGFNGAVTLGNKHVLQFCCDV